MVDRGGLVVGTDFVLGMTPEVIRRVQLRAALWQPDHANPQFPRQPDRAVCRMTGIPIQQQPNRPTPVVVVDGEQFVVPGSAVTISPGIVEVTGRGCQEVAIEPVVNRLARHAKLGGDGCDRAPLSELQEGQGPTEEVGVVGPIAGPAQKT